MQYRKEETNERIRRVWFMFGVTSILSLYNFVVCLCFHVDHTLAYHNVRLIRSPMFMFATTTWEIVAWLDIKIVS